MSVRLRLLINNNENGKCIIRLGEMRAIIRDLHDRQNGHRQNEKWRKRGVCGRYMHISQTKIDLKYY